MPIKPTAADARPTSPASAQPCPLGDAASPRLLLIENWREVLRRAWSVRLIVLAAVLSGFEVALSVMSTFGVKPPIGAGIFAALSGLVTVAAFIARFIAQRKS